jgi:DNA-binding transcriptional ArsR family regulator
MSEVARSASGGPAGRGRPDPEAGADGEAVQVDLVLSALADPMRRRILELLGRGRALSASAMADGLPVSRQAVVQHLAVLERSGLVSGRKAGREVLFQVQPEALTGTASWMNTLAETWTQRLSLLKRVAEQRPADPDSPDFPADPGNPPQTR